MSAPALPTLSVGGRQLTLAPLTFKALREQSQPIRQVATGQFADAFEYFCVMAGIVHASLARHAPELALADVEAALDQPTAELLVNEVLRISFPAAAPGETAAESPSGASTGTPSSST
jgi:hypothetical protein